jgi:hypothetical protein
MMELNREQWLQHAAEAIRRALPDVRIPDVQVSCSWPGGGSPAKRIGECWPTQASAAGINEVFISPKLEDPVKVVQVLTHELAHAVDNCVNGHKAGFVKIGRAMGMTGKPTSMEPDISWATEVVNELLRTCGAFPHRTVDKSKNGVKKQTARMIKCECGECGAVWRMAQKHIDAAEHGMWCPVCGEVSQHGEESGE